MSGFVNPNYKGPVNPNPADGESGIVIYGYVPSLALPVVALVTFALALSGHVARAVKAKRTRTFHWLIAAACLLELVGYASRLYSHKRPFVVVGFVVQYFFIVVAPVAVQAALYLALSAAVKRLSDEGKGLLGFNPKWMVIGMIVADTVTTIIQIAGASLVGTAESSRYRGESSKVTPEQANDILLAGLALQTAAFVVFIVLLSICTWRSSRALSSVRLPTLLTSLLFASSLLLLLRTTFRLAESAAGIFSVAATTEALFGCLEYLPVVVTTWIWVVVPLEKALPNDVAGRVGSRDHPDGDEGKRLEGSNDASTTSV
ncbi:hypothetical protein JCM10212_000255 [Sporobolomyces blumeae]